MNISKKVSEPASEFIIRPARKIEAFSGEAWPFSNVKPAVYADLGLLYGKTEKVGDTGALVYSDMEYSVQNILTGFAFGLFYCMPENVLSTAIYGLSSERLQTLQGDELKSVIKENVFNGNTVYIIESGTPFSYLIWGYRNNGEILLGHKFEEGNDEINSALNFEKPSEFSSLEGNFEEIIRFIPGGEQCSRDYAYREALKNGFRMLTETMPPKEMDFAKVHYGYGQAIYDAWISQLHQANEEEKEEFYFASPVFPHFIALLENRTHLYKFLKMYSEVKADKNLIRAAELCEKLKSIAQNGAQIGFENEWSDPKVLALSNNERRSMLIDVLKECRSLELEIAACMKEYLDSTEN